ncbi:MAG TPA: S8 family serine peptidase [Actinomycetota bacterium]|nr:S8 family serine peptidase [Actinomycetota bacterium]
MPVPSVRRLIASAAALVFVLGVAVPSLADDSFGSTRRAVPTPHQLPARSEEASVDPLVHKQLARNGSVDVLVTLDAASALAGARVPSAGDSEELLRTTVPAYRSLKDDVSARVPGLKVLENYRTLPIVFARVGSEPELERLAADPAVIGVEADRKDELFLKQSLPLINQPAAVTAGHTGVGTAVAVLDTGVDYTRAAFGSCTAPGTPGCKVVVAQDFAPDDGMLDDPAAGRHGTNVSGIVVGVAPDTRILGLDVFNGLSSNRSTQISAINFIIAQQATYNIRAINMSLGSPEDYHVSPCSNPSDGRVAAFASARAAGILPVVAAGNDAESNGSFHIGISSPACIPGALPVGAVYDSDLAPSSCPGVQVDEVTCFSQAWANPMVLAPGSVITAAGISQEGTSQATPHIAGAVAVLHDAAGVASDSPSIATVDQVEGALLNSGPQIFDPLTNLNYRRLDLTAAIAALGATPPPSCTITGTGANDVLEGTPGDDVYCGEGGGDLIVLSGGTDVVDGGAGFDFISLEDASSGGTVDLTAGTADAPGMTTSLIGVEGAVGSDFSDILVGNGGQNEFLGLGGDDAVDGRGGFDFARYDRATARIRAKLGGRATGEGVDTLARIEGIVGGRGNDVLLGSGKVNTLYGLRGTDVLRGGGRPDLLFGGPQADRLFGDGGNDDLFGGPGPDFCDPGPGGASLNSC